MFNQEDKEKKGNVIYVFIDASNVWNVVKSKRKFIEYSHLKNYFKENVFYFDLEMSNLLELCNKGAEAVHNYLLQKGADEKKRFIC